VRKEGRREGQTTKGRASDGLILKMYVIKKKYIYPFHSLWLVMQVHCLNRCTSDCKHLDRGEDHFRGGTIFPSTNPSPKRKMVSFFSSIGRKFFH